MDRLTFISKLVEFLAWPAGLAASAFILRKEIKDLLPSITKLEAGPLKVELARIEKKVADVEEKTNVVIEKIGLSEGDTQPNAPIANAKPTGSPAQSTSAPSVDHPAPTPTSQGLPDSRVADSPANRLRILGALDHREFAMRSLSGIAADTGIHAAAVRAILQLLMEQGLVSETINSEGKVRYFLTSTGMQTLVMTRVNLPATRPGKVVGDM